MKFHVGDKVIHWTYGLGEVIQLDEKEIAGESNHYYVVQVRDMKIWVPVDDSTGTSLRLPTPPSEFDHLYGILSAPGEPLSEDRQERKQYLQDKLKDGQLESICEVVRDLSYFQQSSKMNESDKLYFSRARDSLLTEWGESFSISLEQAEHSLQELLQEVQI